MELNDRRNEAILVTLFGSLVLAFVLVFCYQFTFTLSESSI